MADNVVVTAGTGTTIHADEYTHSTLGSGKTQLVKLVDGTLDSSTPIASGNGTHTNAVRVTMASDSTGTVAATQSGTWNVNNVSGTVSLPTGAATASNQSTIIGHLDGVEGLLTTIDADTGNVSSKIDTLAGAVAGTEMQVDVITLPGSLTGYAEDVAHNTGDIGVQVLAVRKDSGAAIAGTDGDYSPLQLDSVGNLRVNVAAGGAGDGAILDGVSGSIKATVLDYTNSNPLAVRLTDTAGDYVAAGAGTQYTEDDAAASNPVGGVSMLVRADTPAGVATTDGDNVAQRGTNYGAAYVQVVSSSGSFVDSFGGGTQYTEGDVDASITGTAMLMEGAGNTLVPAQGTTTDGLLVNLGTNNDVAVTGSVTANAGTNLNTSALALETGGNLAASATSLAVLDDWDETDRAKVNIVVGQAGVTAGAGAVAANTPRVTLASDDPAVTALQTLDNAIAGSEMQVDVVAALPAGTNNIGDVDVLSVVPGTGTTSLGKAEDGGHTTGDTGVYILGVRNDTPNTALTNTDADYGSVSLYRTGAVRTAIPEEDFAALGSNHVKKYYTNAGAVTDGIVWSPAAGKRWYVTDIFINVSAASTVTLEDDLAGGDSPVWKAELAANSGWSHHFGTPLFSGEDAADLLVTTSAGNVYITVTGYEI